MTDKMKLLWVSNAPWTQTGYGTQTRLFSKRIKDAGFDTAIFGYWGLSGGILNWNGMQVYPVFFEPFGQDVMQAHANHFSADAIFTLTDTWVINTSLIQTGFPWIAWYPIDHINIPPNVRKNLAQAQYRIAMSKFGQKAVMESGLESYYVPHGVDTTLYKPMDKTEARKGVGFPTDKYIYGMVAMNKGNPSRKSFAETIVAFAKVKKTHPDALLYLHTCMATGGEAGGINLPELITLSGLRVGQDVMFPDQYLYTVGFSEQWMSQMYNSLDCLVMVSKGEGFGIPLIEAQACGVPVITGQWTAMEELFFSGQLIERTDAELEWTGLAAYQMKPKIRAIELAMLCEFRNPSSRVKARRCAEVYDVNTVMEKYMLPTITDISDRLMGAKQQYIAETAMALEKNKPEGVTL